MGCRATGCRSLLDGSERSRGRGGMGWMDGKSGSARVGVQKEGKIRERLKQTNEGWDGQMCVWDVAQRRV